MSSVSRRSAAGNRRSVLASKTKSKRPVDDRVVWMGIDALVVNPRNARRHPREQIHKLARVIGTLHVFVPILIDEENNILAGHGRLMAARSIGMTEVPTLAVSGLTDAEKRAFAIADNRTAEKAQWDYEILCPELQELVVLIDVELTGFDTGQVDIMLDDKSLHPDDEPAEVPEAVDVVSRLGDLWQLGPHRLFCGDATAAGSYATLLGGGKANLVFTDPPYNVPIGGHVSGLGKVRHREFAMASGEMSPAQFVRFLVTVFGHLADHSMRASIHYVLMDWRHLREVLSAGHEIYSDLKNICVWNKDNAGMGTLYRSKHEMVLVFQNGSGKFTNNVNLGAAGRYRTNVWDYPGMTSMGKNRMDALAMHPTVKPVALVADAIRDCSKRNELVLDPFSGSGTTIIAAHRTGRIAAAVEIDPGYVDVAVERWQKATGDIAVLASTGETFAMVRAARTREALLATSDMD